MKYSAGQKVRIKSIDWYNGNKNQFGRVNCGDKSYTTEMCFFCGKILTIQAVDLDFYLMEEDNLGYEFTDEMIEGLAEEETLIERVDDPALPFNEWLSHKGVFHIPDGYELKDENGKVINATKIILEKKKKEYPKTYEECCKVLGTYSYNQSIVGYKNELFSALQKLLICRDAYWKIAGEEMGLGKPWEPDWTDDSKIKYGIKVCRNSIQKYDSATWEVTFTFPTEEMRDAFKENFDKDLEFCKELL